MILVDGIHTLVDVIIVDLAQVDFLVWVVSSCGVAAMVATQAKKNYTMIDIQRMHFPPLLLRFLIDYINKQTIFCIHVLTWHDQQRVSMALL
jgi:hypothetical protein